jgi:hypothetical protein
MALAAHARKGAEQLLGGSSWSKLSCAMLPAPPAVPAWHSSPRQMTTAPFMAWLATIHSSWLVCSEGKQSFARAYA